MRGANVWGYVEQENVATDFDSEPLRCGALPVCEMVVGADVLRNGGCIATGIIGCVRIQILEVRV